MLKLEKSWANQDKVVTVQQVILWLYLTEEKDSLVLRGRGKKWLPKTKRRASGCGSAEGSGECLGPLSSLSFLQETLGPEGGRGGNEGTG